MAYEGLKLSGNGMWQITNRKKATGSGKRWPALWILGFIVMLWAIPLTSASMEAETSSEPGDSMEPAAATEKVYRLPPPGEDPRMLYLLVGMEAFRSRKLEKAREAFDKALELDSQNAQAHYFLGLIEYAEGNIEKAKTRFQIAHECLGLSSESPQLPLNSKQAQVEFPDEYEPRMYYRDGWYMNPKNPTAAQKRVYSLEAGSTYRVKLKPRRRRPWIRTSIVGIIVAFSFFLAR